jgi:hypothetical protein
MGHTLRILALFLFVFNSAAFASQVGVLSTGAVSPFKTVLPGPEKNCALNAVIIYRSEMETAYGLAGSKGCRFNPAYIKRAEDAARPSSVDRLMPAYDEFLKSGKLNWIKGVPLASLNEIKCHRLALSIRFLDHLEYFASQENADEVKILSVVDELADRTSPSPNEKNFDRKAADKWLNYNCPKLRGSKPNTPHSAAKVI